MRQNNKFTQNVFYRKNYQIRASEVRVLNDQGEMIGIMPIKEALAKAEELGIDLVEVAPLAKTNRLFKISLPVKKEEARRKKGFKRI